MMFWGPDFRRTESFVDETREKSGGGWRQYGYIYEKERSRLAKIEKMAEALEKKLIFLPKNDSL